MTAQPKLTGWRLSQLWGMLATHGQIAGHDDTGTFYVLDGKVYWLGDTNKARAVGTYDDFCEAVRRHGVFGYRPGPRPFRFEEIKTAAANHGWEVWNDEKWYYASHPRHEFQGRVVRMFSGTPNGLWDMIRLENWRMDKGPKPTEMPTINPLD